jgi:hypothetical protein
VIIISFASAAKAARHAERTPDDRPPIEALIRAVNPQGGPVT